MSHCVKISSELLPCIDEATRTVKDGLGRRTYRTRKSFVDAALEKYLKELEILPGEEE